MLLKYCIEEKREAIILTKDDSKKNVKEKPMLSIEKKKPNLGAEKTQNCEKRA